MGSSSSNVSTINMRSFNGDLVPLKELPPEGDPIYTIDMHSFNEDLIPLKGGPIQTIELKYFTKDTIIGDVADQSGLELVQAGKDVNLKIPISLMGLIVLVLLNKK